MISFFSGTGNSTYVAKRIGEALTDQVVDLFDKIKTGNYSPIHSDCPWVVVTPTYAWQIPGIVQDWLNKTPLTGDQEIYFLLTCGDGIGNAASFAKEYCKQSEKYFKGLAKVVMPENYIAMFDAPNKADAIAIVEKSEPVIADIINTIKHRNRLEAKQLFLVQS